MKTDKGVFGNGQYRYGFNGKEKDDNGAWEDTAYDYGFRIYDPVIARFKSVDPLFRTYAMLTPYQFASNTPISAIDRDGLESEIVINSPWFYNKMRIAWDAGDTDEAQRLAWITINRDRPPDIKGSSEIKDKYKGARTAGTYNWNEANPNVLTVFDSDGNEMFRITREDPPKLVEKEGGSGYWVLIKNLFNWDVEGSGNTQVGGMNFVVEGGKGFTKSKSKTPVDGADITALYTYLSTTKFGATGPPEFKIEEFANSVSGGVQAAKDLSEAPEKPKTMDSCTFCHEVGPDLKHAYETVPTKGKYTKEQAQEKNEQLDK